MISSVIATRSSRKVDLEELQKVREHNAMEIIKIQTHIEWIMKFIPPEDRGKM
jgi:hypothetical protein